MNTNERYWLKRGTETTWTEVDRLVWIKAERAAGFFPKGYQPGMPQHWVICATASFGASYPDLPERRIDGKITRGNEQP